jgi:glycosyltransferase involved in cell wall biosynthesis
MFTYNDERHVAEALGSLLAQTYTDFLLVVVDDCSTDGSEAIIAEHAARDPRIDYHRNPTRVGQGANYRRTFALVPRGVEYYAWAAGHDVHDRRWLARMVETLDQNPDTVLAYSLVKRISDTGEDYRIVSPRFDTVGLAPAERMKALATRDVVFGNMIYGLFRAAALRKAGVFRRVLIPDMLLLWHLALYGTFHQVPEVLWYRRYIGLFSIERQRRNIFGGRPAWHAYLPWPVVHFACLAWATVLGREAGGLGMRLRGLRLTTTFCRRHALAPIKGRLNRIEWVRTAYLRLCRPGGR